MQRTAIGRPRVLRHRPFMLSTRTLDVAYTNSGEYRYFDLGPEQLLRDSLQSEKSKED